MCGYIRRVTDSPEVQDMLDSIGMGHLAMSFSDRKIHSLIVPGEDGPKTVDATWWFDCSAAGDTLKVGNRTTFKSYQKG